MRKHLIQDPIDHLDFHQSLASECAKIETLILSGSYSPSESRRILVEKSKGLCRQLVIPSVRDGLVLQCLSDALYADIRGKEPTDRAFFEPEEHRFSQRKSLFANPEYGSFRAWLNFQKEIFSFSLEKEYTVVTDIANYYDTISYAHLRNIISDLDIGVREPVLDMLMYVLSGLLWQPDYMPRIEIGLPQINLDAPRVLGHCFLYELDLYIQSRHPDNWVRYMDDIDIGVDSVAEAKEILKCIDLVLQTRHVRLNSGKTKIMSRKEAIDHFCIRENHVLDMIEDRIEGKIKLGLPLDRERRSLVRSITTTYRSSSQRFDRGNGGKILRRMLRIAARIKAYIDDDILMDILFLRPDTRAQAFVLITQLPLTPRRAEILRALSASPIVVDDATDVLLANALVETSVQIRRGHQLLLRDTVNRIPNDSFFSLYAKLWLASKYSGRDQILDLVSQSKTLWEGDPWLGRLIGGLYPIFIGSRREANFRELINATSNDEAAAVYWFHDEMRRDPDAFNRSFAFIRSPNPSKGTSISHSKFLLLLSALANDKADKAKKVALVRAHTNAWQDVYYRDRAQGISTVAVP